ncbi:hypothetical protein GDO78_007451 [Eleutherodactylus coqui]|uniref:Uncharacterized protein n=1 Tax=Eleutherodactylus coqui TaxID=57060 RepID=A0A8J6FIN6_ELECQ|nr:hypothetical protein GDO78_007451 [Eleutherodactylus coqui]
MSLFRNLLVSGQITTEMMATQSRDKKLYSICNWTRDNTCTHTATDVVFFLLPYMPENISPYVISCGDLLG